MADVKFDTSSVKTSLHKSMSTMVPSFTQSTPIISSMTDKVSAAKVSIIISSVWFHIHGFHYRHPRPHATVHQAAICKAKQSQDLLTPDGFHHSHQTVSLSPVYLQAPPVLQGSFHLPHNQTTMEVQRFEIAMSGCHKACNIKISEKHLCNLLL